MQSRFHPRCGPGMHTSYRFLGFATPVLEELTQIIVCPTCHGPLELRVFERSGPRVLEGSSRCPACSLDFPIHHGIGAYFGTVARPEDLWDLSNREISEFLSSEPDQARRLMETPLESLNPTDQFVRSSIHEELGDFKTAKVARDRALEGMYTSEFYSAWKSQMRFVAQQLRGRPSPVFDLATGMGSLLEEVLPRSDQQFVATDLSPRVLLRDQLFFESLGLDSRLSFLAFDARHPPFMDRSIGTLVTNVGLANIENPGNILKELRRVVSGQFFAITLFYPAEPGPNSEMIRELGLEPLMYRDSALRLFQDVGFHVQVRNSMKAEAQPTPKGVIMSEVQPDRLPVIGCEVEFCTLVAS